MSMPISYTSSPYAPSQGMGMPGGSYYNSQAVPHPSQGLGVGNYDGTNPQYGMRVGYNPGDDPSPMPDPSSVQAGGGISMEHMFPFMMAMQGMGSLKNKGPSDPMSALMPIMMLAMLSGGMNGGGSAPAGTGAQGAWHAPGGGGSSMGGGGVGMPGR